MWPTFRRDEFQVRVPGPSRSLLPIIGRKQPSPAQSHCSPDDKRLKMGVSASEVNISGILEFAHRRARTFIQIEYRSDAWYHTKQKINLRLSVQS